MKKIRIFLADEHTMFREGIAELLRGEADMEVIGAAGDGQQALEQARQLKPDVVVMEVLLPGLSGIEAARQIRAELPGVQVLALSGCDDEEPIFAMLEAGACGYLLKKSAVSELVRALRLVQAGESPLDPAVARKVVDRLAGSNQPQTAAEPDELVRRDMLTLRELEVLKLLAQGLSNRAIAERMFISDRTVQAHLTSIFAKTHVGSRLEAVLLAIRKGWME